MYYTIGGFTLDDTVTPDGNVQWAAPGGNALYSAIGAKFWTSEVGIITPIGNDYPKEYLAILSKAGFDLSGIRKIDYPSFHVWILHEGDGKRQIIYRLDSGNNTFLDPVVKDLPSNLSIIKGVHICPILGNSQANLLRPLIDNNVPTFLDLIVIPDQIDVSQGHHPVLWKKLRAFIPSLEEVIALFGDLPLPSLLEKLEEVGPDIFAVKLGHRGSIVRNPSDKSYYYIPAYQANVVDATGAGDSYCGGFMVGLQELNDPIKAALYGTISASFLIEGFGALHALDITNEQANERLNFLQKQVKRLSEIKLDIF